MTLALQDIARPGKHYGGVGRIWLALPTDITDIPAASALAISGNITMASGKAFVSIDVIENSISFSENQSRDGNGIKYDQRLSIDVGKAELVKELQWAAACRRVVCMMESRNGDLRIIGSLNAPAKLTYGLSKGQGYSGSDKYAVTISSSSRKPAYYYTGSTSILNNY